ncbi:BNR-4 repeat-containing protein [Salegentibacter sp. F188]|uniref:BNR-4 repeat-containing protein n=1 Tax=Autumnicola patrickiae TaxID=3075591 RepID=A0ABU3E087_9FLAO|nr:BNR-4 repeat-containing protein [Salegentibacter sp. F188]MDT0689376.1 BNR-4 repeat-containing protein [Salegentibacter sp. F188]
MNPFIHALFTEYGEMIQVTEVGETLAYTWFGRPNIVFSEEANKYWVGSTRDILEGTTQHVTEFDLINNTYTPVRVGTVYEKDDHNQAQILIRSSDKRLIAFYSEHNGAAIRYRISTNPLSGLEWGEENILNPGGTYTYPSPYQSTNGNIFLFYRTGHYWRYIKSTDGGETFGSPVLFYDNNNRKAYLISSQDGDKVHFVGSSGHPNFNSDLNLHTCHFYFDLITETFHQTTGEVIPVPFASENATTVNQPTRNDSSWILDVTTKNRNPRVLYILYPDAFIADFFVKHLYFAEFINGSWEKTFIAETMSGYMYSGEKGYSGASRFDASNPDIIWMPKQVGGILEIHKVDLNKTGSRKIEQITFNSEVDNWRPISCTAPKNNLLWLKNNRYTTFTDYDISLIAKTV